MYRIWYSSESFKDFIVDNTILKDYEVESKKIYESDGNNPRNFHTLPDHLKKILYLDCPDIIVEKDFEPIFSIEDTKEAGTGHNAFQRFARLAASAENNVPCFYIYPEAKIIRRGESFCWDKINPLVFKALDVLMDLYSIPNLLFYYPSDFRYYQNNPLDSPNLNNGGLQLNKKFNYLGCPAENNYDMDKMFEIIDEIVNLTEKYGVIEAKKNLVNNRKVREQRDFMRREYFDKNPNNRISSPITNTIEVPTSYLLNYLNKYEDRNYQIGELIKSRETTIIYQVNANFRGDPYPGALAAIDYIMCRTGKTFEERDKNLVLAWGNIELIDRSETFELINTKETSIDDFFYKVRNSDLRSLTSKKFYELENYEIPRYYMQARYGTMFTKSKEIRMYT